MIYVLANSKAVSGGPELAQQLCNKMNGMGYDAKMVYFSRYRFPETRLGSELIGRYSTYNNSLASRIEDTENNVIIYPETALFLLPKFKKIKKVIWWMSVDNYYNSLNSKYYKRYDFFGKMDRINIFGDNYYHCCQSQYAKEFLLEKGVEEKRICMLSDYTNKSFLEETKDEMSYIKENNILYNPKKGIEFTQNIKKKMPNINWIPLENMSRSEMINTMKRSKLYIDFGNHPGKDRIPREAAICGCCVITNMKGSAKNKKDVPIPQVYKFDTDKVSIEVIINKIMECLNEYEKNRGDFDDYREIIKNEESLFCEEIQKMINKFL